MKTLAIFGATGKTGSALVEQALSEGYKVNALVREPSKISIKHNNLNVIKGDVANYDAVNNTIKGADAVISVIGHVKNSPKDIQTIAIRNITRSMKENGINQLVSLTGGTVRAEGDKPKIADRIIMTAMKLLAKDVLADAIAHVNEIKKTNLDWTIPRAPRIIDGPFTGNYRIGMVGVNASTSISRRDLADFLLKVVKEKKYVHELPFISS